MREKPKSNPDEQIISGIDDKETKKSQTKERENLILKASSLFDHAREESKNGDVSEKIDLLINYLKDANATPDELNVSISEETLETIRKNGYIAEAKKWLKFAKERSVSARRTVAIETYIEEGKEDKETEEIELVPYDNKDVKYETERVRKYIEKAGINLEEIGISEEDMQKMESWKRETK